MRDSFAIGQEPDLLRAGNTYNTYQRISGDNLRNYGSIDLLAQLTPEFGLDLGYANTFYSYADNQYIAGPGPAIQPSNSGLLDELESKVHLDGRYQLQPQTVGIIGTQFRDTRYIGNQPIAFDLRHLQFESSDSRNVRSYYGYVGLDHNFRPDLTGSVRVGGYYNDYYKAPNNQNGASPYAMASLQYSYLPESYLQVGASYDYSTSSAFQASANGDLTLNAESATVYATIKHRITPKLYGSILAQFQNSTYYGGAIDGNTDQDHVVGLNLQYRFTPNFSAEVGYDYDRLESNNVNYFGAPGNGGYDRNRVYIGVTGSY